MRRLLLVATVLLLGAAPPDERQRLADAKREAGAASVRADGLTAAASRETDAALRARTQERALTMRVTAAQAGVQAAEARVALVAAAQAQAQARLAAAQAPTAHLLAALTAMARRPTVAAIAQPGSVDDMVHVRALLGAQLPVVRARAAGVRAELAEVRRLQADAALAAQALRDGRARLENDRVALAQLEARHRAQAQSYGERAIGEADRALALGEQARDLVDRMTEQGQASATVAELAPLAGPLPRPLAPGIVPLRAQGAYRLPVAGRLLTGFGEVSPAGVRARGLTFAVAPGAPVVAPAGGTVRYARAFRGYGIIVVIDHGDGWSTLLTGLAATGVHTGQSVRSGTPVGRAAAGDEPRVTVELRRRGRPADLAALVG
ncbi:murein hydrolase activator EnvC family protein [Sphingomonas sp.]|uniref:murein hydrolase activator EnvC family protein n=1 Tax=Sphingomonas sp. TaxID=28214 RepID=UPI003B0004D6